MIKSPKFIALFIGICIVIMGILGYLYLKPKKTPEVKVEPIPISYIEDFLIKDENYVEEPDTPKNLLPTTQFKEVSEEDVPLATIIAKSLNVPWSIAFLPNGSMFVSERAGNIIFIDSEHNFTAETIGSFEDVTLVGESGVLGLAVHPNFEENNYLYVYYSYSDDGTTVKNRVVRYVYKDEKLNDGVIIVDNIPGAEYHDGGRMAFGPDGFLYITTGDAQIERLAQDKNSLAGKILRVKDDGTPVEDNPFENAVYSYGHRNPQGIAWDTKGNLWATEHGRSGFLSGLDEINKIEKGANYGWPIIQGDSKNENMKVPYIHSGNDVTWAPAGAAIIGDTMYFVGLKGKSIYSMNISDPENPNIKTYITNQFGRLRDIVVGPDGYLYITTSNRDGRGNPAPYDDKVIRINQNKLTQ